MAMEPAEFRMKTRFVVKLGRALHECGASSERVERHLNNVTRMLGLNGSFLLSPTTFTCAFWQEDELDQLVHIERFEPADHNMGRLWEIDRLVERIAAGELGLAEGLEDLKLLTTAPPNYSTAMNALAWALIGGSFAALLSPSTADFITATLLSLVLFFISHLCGRHPGWKSVVTILVPFAAGVIAGGVAALGVAINIPFVILSAIVVFIPGLALTVSLTEISAGHLISGSSRLVDAGMLLLKLFFGSIGGMALAAFLWQAPAAGLSGLPPLPDWKTWPAVIGLSLGLGIAFNIPRRKMGWGLLSAVIAFSSARLGGAAFGMYAGMFIGALAVGLYSNLFSRITRGPGSILMMQGIILLVPGSRTYMILNHWVSGQEILPGSGGGSQAMMVFIALVAGLLFSNALFPTRKSL